MFSREHFFKVQCAPLLQSLPLALEQYAYQLTVQQASYLLQKRRRMVRSAVSRPSSKKEPCMQWGELRIVFVQWRGVEKTFRVRRHHLSDHNVSDEV